MAVCVITLRCSLDLCGAREKFLANVWNNVSQENDQITDIGF